MRKLKQRAVALILAAGMVFTSTPAVFLAQEAAAEAVTEKQTEAVTEKPTEKVTEKQTEKVTEKQTEKVTEAPTEKPTEKVTEKVTEKPTEKPTEKVTEKQTEKVTEASTQAPTEAQTEKENEKAEETTTEAGKETEKPSETEKAAETTEKQTEKSYTVSFKVSEGAKVTVNEKDVTNASAKTQGESIVFTVKADEGYEIASVTADHDVKVTPDSKKEKYTAAGIKADGVVISVSAKKAQAEVPDISVRMQAVDENGSVIGGSEYFPLPKFDGTLVLNNKEKAPLDIDRYEYTGAMIDGKKADGLVTTASVKDEDGKVRYAYAYTTGGKQTAITKDTVIRLSYREVFEKRTYRYSDSAVTVTATLEKKNAVPDNAQLRVKSVANGGTYLEALNNSVEGSPYNAENTLLYDIGFFVPVKDEVGNDTDQFEEFQPEEGSVRINMTFNRNQVSDQLGANAAGNVEVAHLPETNPGSGDVTVEHLGANVSLSGSTDHVSFSTTNFSVFAISYTVDFTYDGFTYSIAGEESILLSELFAVLGISEDASKAVSVKFSDESLVSTAQTEGDWILTSLAPFQTEETLTVTMASGAKYEIAVTDAQGELALTDISNSITATAENNIEGIERDAKFSVTINYALKDSEVGRAKENRTWTYDLSSLTNSLKSISGTGNLYDGTTPAGTFEVIDNVVYLHIDEDYIKGRQRNVSGTFSLDLSLDADKIGTNNSVTIDFPGANPLSPTFNEASLGSSKTVNNSSSDSGETVTVTPADDGTYRLTYYVQVNPNATVSELNLTDTISGKQTFDAGSFKMKVGYSDPEIAVSPVINGSTFTLDVTNALGRSLKKNEPLYVTYETVITEENLGNIESNKAEWSWSGKDSSNTTKVKTRKKISIKKDVEGSDGTYTYTIKIGDEKTDLAGVTVIDKMSDNQIPQGEISISPAVSGVSINGSNTFQDESFSDNRSKFFEFIFPENGSYVGPYTITYTVNSKPSAKEKVNLSNITEVSKDGNTDSDDANISYEPTLGEDISAEKTLTEWNIETKTITWSATISLADTAVLPLTNVVISESDFKYDVDANGYNNWSDGVGAASMELDLSNVSIETASGAPVDFEVNNNDIVIPELEEKIIVSGIKTIVPEEFTKDLWASNKITVAADGQKDATATVTERYNDGTIPAFMTKEGVYNKSTGEFSWTVVINANQETVDPDQAVIFGDALPENHEMVENSINVSVSGLFHGNKDVSVNVSEGNIERVTLTGPEAGSSIWENPYYCPNGISGNMFTITYKTKFTEDGLAAFNNAESITSTNTAFMYDESEEAVSAEGSVKVEHDYVIKEDISQDPLSDDTVSYSISVNPEGLTLNDGAPLTLTDNIETAVNLVLNSVKVSGTSDAVISYNDDSRILTVTVPDATACTVVFNVRAEELGKRIFANSCELKGKDTWSDQTAKEHDVQKHAGTVSGAADTIYLKKIDEYNITKPLKDAEFDLYLLSTDDSGTITGGTETPIRHVTSDGTGTVVLDELEPYQLYAWVETKPPANYMISTEEPHHFIMYPIAFKDGIVDEAQTAANRDRAKELDEKIQAANGITVNTIKDTSSWTVTNIEKETEGATVSISKVDAADSAELTGAQLTVTKVKDAAGAEVSEEIDSWTSEGTAYEITDLTDGTYELVEDQAPLGYQTAEKITFVIKDGKLVEDANAKDGVVTMKDELNKTDVKISKVDAGQGTELAGAQLTVTKVKDAEGKDVSEEIDSWTSDGTAYEITGLTDGTYELVEDQAPLGYQTAEKITFVIKDGELVEDENAKDGVVTMKDELYKGGVSISKQVLGQGTELAGAELTVTKKGETAPIRTWTSDGSQYLIENLEDGTYVLTETSAPEGYEVAESIEFTISGGKLVEDENAKGGVVTMTDALKKTDVKISKVDVADSAELEGAQLTVTKVKDIAGEEVNEEIDSWTSNGTAHKITGLTDGTYELVEDQAPLGYRTAEKITFEIKDGELVESDDIIDGVVTMKDELNKTDVKISKVDAADSAELAGAKLTVTKVKDAAGEEASEVIESWTSDGTVHEITGLTDGTYELVEDQAPLGYKTAETITFEIKDDELVENEDVKDGVVTMKDELYKTDVKISKVDAGQGSELAGATLTLTKEGQEEAVDSWISDGSIHTVSGLTDGVYTLVEESAPEGYKKAESVTFTIKDGMLVEEGNDAVVDGVVMMADEQYKGGVSISKQVLGQGNELAGADLSLIKIADAAGSEVSELIDSWTSNGSQHEIADLADGIYVLTETSAPEGFEVAESIEFEIVDSKLVEGENAKNGVVTMQDAMKKTNVRISKVDAGAGSELKGAELTVTRIVDIYGDKVNDLIESWTSDGTACEITGLTDGTYELVEDQAPLGYQTAEKITFVIKDGKLVEDANAKDGVVTMKDELNKTDVKISKVDAGQGTELAGAQLTVTKVKDAEGKDVSEEIDSWTSDGTAYEITGLTDGTYELVEDQAPLGYQTAEKIKFVIKDGKLVTEGNDDIVDGIVTMKDEQYKTDVKISKQDLGQGTELEGAELTVTMKTDAAGKESGKEVEKWTSDGTVHEIKGLADGTYELKEDQAPLGYQTAESITFVIKDGKLVTEGNDDIADGIVTMKDAKTSVSISKQDVAGNELSEAKIQILNGDKEVIDEWTSGEKPHVIEGLEVGTVYTLHEVSAPDNTYTVISDVTFTVDDKNEVKVTGTTTTGDVEVKDGKIVITDTKTSVSISKADAAGNELAGATIQILDGDGEVVDEWTSGEEAHVVEGLEAGTVYTLHEVSAPDNTYTVISDVTFTVDEKNEVKVTGTTTTGDVEVKDGKIVITDDKTSVSISKVDIANGKELKGATIQILDGNGKVVEINGEKLEWVSTNKAHVVTGLETGTEYTLHEVTAPEGYAVAADTKFVLKDDGTIDSSKTTTTVKNGILLVEDEVSSAKGSITFEGGKVLNGRKMTAKDIFTFEIKEKESGKTWKFKNDADGNILYPTITYVKNAERDDTGTHTYTIRETSESKDGITVDDFVYTIKVTVSYNKTRKLVVKADKPDEYLEELNFFNTYKARGSVTLRAKKTFVGGTLSDGQFEIELVHADGSVITAQPVKADGSVILYRIDFQEGWDGTYEYTIREKLPEGVDEDHPLKDGILYDTTEHKAVVTAKDNGKGKMEVSVVYDEKSAEDIPEFFNALLQVKIRKVDSSTQKALKGATLQVLEGKKAIKTWKSDGKDMVLTGLEPGVLYTIHETAAPSGYSVASDKTFMLAADGSYVSGKTTAKIAKDGALVFENTAEKTKKKTTGSGGGSSVGKRGPIVNVETGDDTPIALYLGLLAAAAAAAAAAGIIIFRRRRRK